MSPSASRVTAALLCVVAFGALVIAYIGLPSTVVVAEPMNLDLDFGVMAPGVPETRTSTLDVPVASTVHVAHASSTTGADDVAVEFELCRDELCRALTAGEDVEPGIYTLRVSATLTPDLAPGTSTSIAGQLQLTETKSTGLADPGLLLAVAVIGVGGAFVVAVTSSLTARRRGAAS